MRTALITIPVAVLAACGGHATYANDPLPQGADAGALPPPSQALLPLVIGNTWTYQVTDPTGAVTSKQETVTQFVTMTGLKQGQQAFVLEEIVPTGKSELFLEARSDFVLRHEEDTYLGSTLSTSAILSPPSIRSPETMPAAGAKWSEQYLEQDFDPTGKLTGSKTHIFDWQVVSTSDVVTVPAGTFTALKLQRLSAGGKIKLTWWLAGVGKIREDDSGTIDELSAYQLK